MYKRQALAPYYDVTLIYSLEKKGVLSNPEDDDSVIPVITHADFERYKAEDVYKRQQQGGARSKPVQRHTLRKDS